MSCPLENLNLNTTQLSLDFGCAGLEGCIASDDAPPAPGSGVPVAQATLSRIEILLRDIMSPEVVAAATGRLLEGGSLSGVVRASVGYRDRGGGVRGLSILVDGKPVAENVISGQSCRQPSAYSVPCPLSGRIEVELDTTGVPDGAHRVELELRDVAGNRTLVGPYPIEIRNTPPPPQAAPTPPPPTPGRLTLSRYSVRAKYGARAVVEGTLVDFGGAPLAGAQIEVASRPLMRNAVFSAAAPVLTDGSGRFTVPVAPGPSRTFRLRYVASEVSGEVVIPAPVKLKVSPKRTRNGKSVRFAGTIPGTDAGTRVELQARAGRRWVPFRTALLEKGKFSARYKFTSTATTQRYSFRAVVRADPNFPYASAVSPAVTVVVRP